MGSSLLARRIRIASTVRFSLRHEQCEPIIDRGTRSDLWPDPSVVRRAILKEGRGWTRQREQTAASARVIRSTRRKPARQGRRQDNVCCAWTRTTTTFVGVRIAVLKQRGCGARELLAVASHLRHTPRTGRVKILGSSRRQPFESERKRFIFGRGRNDRLVSTLDLLVVKR